MYLSMVLSMAEMSSALPTAGGGYTFARRALGPWGGFATGTAILIEYAIAPAAIATFIGSYVESLHLPGLTDGWWIYLAVYAVFIGIHLSGAGEALRTMFIITGVALVGLAIFTIGAVGRFDVHNLTNIPVDESARGHRRSCRTGTWASGRRCHLPSGCSWRSKVFRSRPRRLVNRPRTSRAEF